MPDERTLITATLSGDTEAFSGLVRKYQKQAYAIARSMLVVHEDAEDAVQDAFSQAFYKLDTFQVNRPLGPWIAAITTNKARDIVRKSRAHNIETLEEELLPEEHRFTFDSLDDPAETFDLSDRLANALARLPERQRVIVVMYSQGFPHAEIAATLGIPNGTCRADLHKARGVLRHALG